MTNKEIYIAYSGLYDLRKAGSVRFPARVSFAIIHNMRQLEPVVAAYEDAKTILLQENGTLSEDNLNAFVVPPEKISYVSQELSTLDDTQVGVIIQRINMGDLDGLDLTLQDMDALYFMIEEEEG